MTEQTVNDKLQDVAEAVAREKAALQETITQLKTDLEAASRGDPVALAALQGQVDGLSEKVNLLDADRDLWRKEAWWRRERAGEEKYGPHQPTPPVAVVKPDAVKPEATPLVPVPKLAAGKAALLPFETMLGKLAASPSRALKDIGAGSFGNVNNSVVSGIEGMVGRAVNTHLSALMALDKLLGTNYELPEIVRLLPALRKSMVWRTDTLKGKTVSGWSLRDLREPLDVKEIVNGQAWNHKERSLGAKVLARMARRLKDALKTQPELQGDYDFCLGVAMFEVERWLLRDGSLWPRDRVIHPWTDYILAMHYLYECTGQERFSKARDEALPLLEAEMMVYDDPKYGPCLTYAYNVLGAPGNEGTGNKDGYQPAVYTFHNTAKFMEVGLNGLGMFATREFQERHANTMFMLLDGGPFTLKGETESYQTETYKSIAPRAYWYMDAKTAPPKDLTIKNKYQTRVLEAAKRVNDTYTTGAGHVKGGGLGLALAFGPEGLVREVGRRYLGNLRGDELDFLVGAALRAGLQSGGVKWT